MLIVRVVLISVLLLWTNAYAAVYKCEVKGKVTFSDQPCATNAEKVEVKVYQPKAEDIAKQRETTKQYNEDNKYTDWDALREKNKALERKIEQLVKQWKSEAKALESKLYSYSDTMVATSEHDLFDRINAVDKKYKQQINEIRSEIQRNEQRMFSLKSQIDAQN